MKLNLNKIATLLLLGIAVPGALSAAALETKVSRTRWLMGTFCSIDAWGDSADAAVTAAFDEIDHWDRVLSLYKKESELNALNASAGSGPFRASADLYGQTEAALRLARETRGAFDPTILPLTRRGPEALPLVGWAKVRLNPKERTIELPLKGMGLDFGGIGKGWALDHAAAVLRKRGVTRAFFNFGGQILAFGTPEGGGDWTVLLPGRQEPLKVRDASVSTSGNQEHPGHIVSPFNGLPVRGDIQATAILPSATDADAWSTALFVLGKIPAFFPGRAYLTTVAPRSQKGDHR